MKMNPGTLAPPARNRITRELSQLSTDPPPGISCYSPEDNLTYLHSTITGPPDSPFASGVFLVAITIPNRYPFEPPKCRFLTPIHHPNIDSAGRICLDTLKSPPNGSWSPAVSLPSLLLTLRALMGEPNAEDGLVADVTEQFKSHHQLWFAEAKRLTEVEATEAKLVEREEAIRVANLSRSQDLLEDKKRIPVPRAFIKKRRGQSNGKENKLKTQSFNIMEEDDEHETSVMSGKRKEGEVDNSLVENGRDMKFRRHL